MSPLQSMWASAKRTRRIGLGPISFFFRIAKTARLRSPRPPLLRWLMGEKAQAAVATSSVASTAARPGLRGGVALIVGAGPGLGEALATSFAAAGMSVALAARNGSRLSTVVEHLQTLGRATYRAYPCDATSES